MMRLFNFKMYLIMMKNEKGVMYILLINKQKYINEIHIYFIYTLNELKVTKHCMMK